MTMGATISQYRTPAVMRPHSFFSYSKISDRGFVQNMEDERDQVVVKAIIDLAHNLGLSVVAEGVETV